MPTALVFAGQSFIGRWLCAGLRQRNWSVLATTRTGQASDTIACTLLDRSRVEAVVQQAQPTWVFQCAGATHGNDLRAAFDLHVTGTLNVLDAVRRHAPMAGVLLLGSAAEYGLTTPDRFPVAESHPTVPQSFFGASKLAQTELARVVAAEWGLRIVTVRPFNVIGPGLPEYYFATAVANRLRGLIAPDNPREFPVHNAQATRDFVDVRDVVEALIALAEADASSAGQCPIFNIATGIETPLLELATELGRLAGGFVPIPAGDTSSRGGAVRSCGDATRLRQAVGWSPRRSWRESVGDMWRTLGMSTQAA